MSQAILHSKPIIVKRMRYLMGGLIKIEVTGLPGCRALEAVEAAFAEIKRIEQLLSRFIPTSVVTLINQKADIRPVHVSDEVFDLLMACREISFLSGGVFDVTTLPLTNFWQQAEQTQAKPHVKEIEEVKSQVGFKQMILDAHLKTVFFIKPGMKIDLGAIGKGYAVDRAIYVLRQQGVRHGFVNGGSTIAVIGQAPFAVMHPLQPDKMVACINLSDNSLSTSGVYERFWSIKDSKYGHLIHPLTGYPVQTDLLSVSTVQETALLSDAFSTTAFILGEKKGVPFLKRVKSQKTVAVASHQLHPFVIIRTAN
ncbi:MAG: hypothetical protein COV74_09365 [Candidatus Omnitrophica bacterium CG11_big_fil_rev_8_21_14_0_20_45_26]|uniref:FAD:protein FMN transferase n=1 Tax=Candidatus Abzuiibacterium crystallinum TaxID=1974748 RepID=A0A2H0LLM3_9BACT|nr:MAG: hypothetical protein COV74_09365 [Candidatus Omnitrophica bacterium CG11_big_fil_rev_8_21_14_0_20_45_26]PIW65361.1 MAG: hypothetical protein COW12_02305 [Candidatus Omnitrophica bacterium CG12_big_fil_rev_8_21_14_0_65_45_16]